MRWGALLGLRECSGTVERKKKNDCLDTQQCIERSRNCDHSVREIKTL